MRRAEVAIVGAGAAGLMAARELVASALAATRTKRRARVVSPP